MKKVVQNNSKIKTPPRLLSLIIISIMMTLFSVEHAVAQHKDQMVRIARIEVDPAQLKQYNAALKEQMETAVRVEPGVLTYYAVADKNNPAHITILEIYADSAAYRSHIETPHFRKYKSTTKDMVKSLQLVDVDLIASATKATQ